MFTVTSRRITFISLFIVILVFSGGLSLSQDITTVTLSTLSLEEGESVVVEGRIECAADGCSAFDITFTFDPALLQIDSLEVGPYLGEDIFEVENSIDNEEGIARLAAVAFGDPPPVEDPLLFIIQVTMLSEVSASLEVTELIIGDLLGEELEATAEGGTIDTTGSESESETTAPPKPPTVEGNTGSGGEAPTGEEATMVEPCFVFLTSGRANDTEVYIRVGPGYGRGARGSFPVGEDVLVVGQAEDSNGNGWWKIQPVNYNEAEADRYWVAMEPVETRGGCDTVGDSIASDYVEGGSQPSTEEQVNTPPSDSDTSSSGGGFGGTTTDTESGGGWDINDEWNDTQPGSDCPDWACG